VGACGVDVGGRGVAVGTIVLVAAGAVALGVDVGVGVAWGVAVAEGVAEGDAPGVRVGLAVAVTDGVGADVRDAVAVGVRTGVPVAVDGSAMVGTMGPSVSVARDVCVGLGGGWGVNPPLFPWFPPAGPTTASRAKPIR
jgi:hypothetical protein